MGRRSALVATPTEPRQMKREAWPPTGQMNGGREKKNPPPATMWYLGSIVLATSAMMLDSSDARTGGGRYSSTFFVMSGGSPPITPEGHSHVTSRSIPPPSPCVPFSASTARIRDNSARRVNLPPSNSFLLSSNCGFPAFLPQRKATRKPWSIRTPAAPRKWTLPPKCDPPAVCFCDTRVATCSLPSMKYTGIGISLVPQMNSLSSFRPACSPSKSPTQIAKAILCFDMALLIKFRRSCILPLTFPTNSIPIFSGSFCAILPQTSINARASRAGLCLDFGPGRRRQRRKRLLQPKVTRTSDSVTSELRLLDQLTA
mmetsp:Transcript_55472/g.108610  ORF Transcript_55472/g.108610 Transcript_55472/m.108610 type:complete len:315 (-) Transcript_55472:7-951(-)